MGAASQGDLASVGLEEGGIANQAGAGDVGVGDRHDYGGAKDALAKLDALAGGLVNDYGILRSPKSCRSRPGRVTFTDTFRPAGSGRS